MRYTKLLFLLVIALGIFACGGEKQKDDHTKTHEMMVETTDVVYYTCPMESHKHIHSMEADTCTECEMALIPVVKGNDENHDFYGCPMVEHSHVRSDEPGVCAECGMTLEPLKFKPI